MKRWTPEEDALARQLREQGRNASEIARKLGRHRSVIETRLDCRKPDSATAEVLPTTPRTCLCCGKPFMAKQPPALRRICRPCRQVVAGQASAIA